MPIYVGSQLVNRMTSQRCRGTPWDGMEWDNQNCRGMGWEWDEKKCPMDNPGEWPELVTADLLLLLRFFTQKPNNSKLRSTRCHHNQSGLKRNAVKTC